MRQQKLTEQKLTGALRLLFGLIWGVDAYLKWSPAFFAEYLSLIKMAARGQPRWLQPWFHFWIAMVARDPHGWALFTAFFESATALGLIFGFAQKIGYGMGILFSLGVWSTAEGFGGPYTPGATDVGTAIIYAVVFLYLAALQYSAGMSEFSLDRLIIRRWPAWSKIASFGGGQGPGLA
ncbi:MAG: hypothetical protein M0Z41_07890 [Peptococcaceae bacterium]|nr:hypothetical protein [Peptococcaceae bacterium]